MADLKISALPASTTPLAGTEVLPVVQSSTTKQVSVANLTAGRSVSVADLTATTGNIIIGTSGKGIDFSATSQAAGMTSELLNDYEEGTWTPTDASGAGLTFTTATGLYTKIGRLVVATFRVIYPVTANGSNAIIGGLPFASGNYARDHQGSGLRYTNSSLVFTLTNQPLETTFQPVLTTGVGVTNAQLSSFIIDGMVVYSV